MRKSPLISCVAALAVAAALMGCTKLERSARRQDDAAQLQTETRQRVAERLAAFAAEPRVDCASDNLRSAVATAVRADRTWARRRLEPELREVAGSLVLEVADTARASGCSALTEDVYAYILSAYAGADHAAFRERAQARVRGP